MTPSDACFNLIKRFESCRLNAYLDERGIPTIGWGHTGPEVHLGMTISQDIADALLLKDVTHAADAVNRAVTAPITQAQYDAFVSLAYNIGPGSDSRDGIIRLRNGNPSSFLRKLNAGDSLGAAQAMLAWVHAGDHISNGLVKRRAAEQSLFLS